MMMWSLSHFTIRLSTLPLPVGKNKVFNFPIVGNSMNIGIPLFINDKRSAEVKHDRGRKVFIVKMWQHDLCVTTDRDTPKEAMDTARDWVLNNS